MLTGRYVFGNSAIHRTRPIVKIVTLGILCTSLFFIESWVSIAITGAVVIIGFTLAGLKANHFFISLYPAFWGLLVIFVVQVLMANVLLASFVIARYIVLISAASLVTLTTKTSEFVDGIRSALEWAPSWVPKEHIALLISISLRFIPLVWIILDEIRQAQKARGLDRNLLALLVPLTIRMLKTANKVSQAIYARSFCSGKT